MKSPSSSETPRPVSAQIPPRPDQYIDRPHYAEILSNLFQNEDAVVLTDSAGAGRTTLLAEFARQHETHAVTLFLRPVSRFSYDPTFIAAAIAEQLRSFARHDNISSDSESPEAAVRRLYVQLGNRRSMHDLFFIIDGLDDLPHAEETSLLKQVLDLLPFGLPRTKFLLTGHETEVVLREMQRLRVVPHRLPGFSPPEVAAYFADQTQDSGDLAKLREFAGKGNPGKLAVIRRLLVGGVGLKELLGAPHRHLADLFRLEWNRLDIRDDLTRRTLAICAFETLPISLSQIADLLQTDIGTLTKNLSALPIIEINKQSGLISFVNEGYRNFVREELKDLKQSVMDSIIGYLRLNPDDPQAAAHLPTTLLVAERHDQLLECLTPEFVHRILRHHTGSLTLVRHHLSLGIDAALHLRNHAEFLHYSLSRALLDELRRTTSTVGRVRAYLALDDHENARLYAECSRNSEDRLHLFAIIARSRIDAGLSPDQNIFDEMTRICDDPTLTLSGDRATEIATDLIHTLPDKAVGLVRRSASDGDSAHCDFALFNLSLQAGRSDSWRQSDPRIDRDPSQTASDLISNSNLREILENCRLAMTEVPADTLIKQISDMSKLEAKLLLLSTWAKRNGDRADTPKLLSFGIDLLLANGGQTVTALDIRRLLSPLPSIRDPAIVASLVARVDAIKCNLPAFGATVDRVRLDAVLARSEYGVGMKQEAIHRLTTVVLELCDNSDPITKAECASWICSEIRKQPTFEEVLKADGVVDLLREQLSDSITSVLTTHAIHDTVIRSTIRSVATFDFALAIAYSKQLNTQDRRDNALLEIVSAAVRNTAIETSTLEQAIEQIDGLTAQSSATEEVIRAVAAAKIDKERTVRCADWLYRSVQRMPSTSQRCVMYGKLLKIYGGTQTDWPAADKESFAERCRTELLQDFQCLDRTWVQIELGYEIATTLADANQTLAREFVARVEAIESECEISTWESAAAVTALVRLAISAAAGLVEKRFFDQTDMQRIAALIAAIPSDGESARLWAALAERTYLMGDISKAQAIVNNYLRPAFAKVSLRDTAHRYSVLDSIAPSLFFTSRQITLEFLQPVPIEVREQCIVSIVEFLLRRAPSDEPYEAGRDPKYDATDTVLREVLDLAAELSVDSNLAYVFSAVADATEYGDTSNRLTREQRADIATRIQEIKDRCLPSPKYITHNGYSLYTDIQMGRIRNERSRLPQNALQSIAAIPNASDRVFLYCTAASATSNREQKVREDAIAAAMSDISVLTHPVDRVSRLRMLAQEVAKVDRVRAVSLLRDALTAAQSIDSTSATQLQRQAIDMAFRIDPNIAKEICTALDDDPAKLELRLAAQRQVQILENRNSLPGRRLPRPKKGAPRDGGSTKKPCSESIGNTQDVSEFAWRSVAAMNAQCLSPVRLDEIHEELLIASRSPLSESFPAYLLAVTSSSRLYSDKDAATTITRSVFEACLKACEIAVSIHQFASHRRSPTIKLRDLSASSAIVKPGDRSEVEKRIRAWLQGNSDEFLVICDPYFGVDDLESLRWVQEEVGNIPVTVLTGMHPHRNIANIEEAYIDHWRNRVLSTAPPPTEIVIAYLDDSNKTAPIHDRWWLTKHAGLRFGTSINALGESRITEISTLDSKEVEQRLDEVNAFVTRGVREFNRKRVKYSVFSL